MGYHIKESYSKYVQNRRQMVKYCTSYSIDDSYIITGTSSNCLPRLKNRISNLSNNCKYFYIGLTNRPKTRFQEHRNSDGILWDRMVVLYKTSSLRKEGDFEESLILYYKNGPRASKLKNIKNGRQGALSAPPYYIYAIFKY